MTHKTGDVVVTPTGYFVVVGITRDGKVATMRNDKAKSLEALHETYIQYYLGAETMGVLGQAESLALGSGASADDLLAVSRKAAEYVDETYGVHS